MCTRLHSPPPILSQPSASSRCPALQAWRRCSEVFLPRVRADVGRREARHRRQEVLRVDECCLLPRGADGVGSRHHAAVPPRALRAAEGGVSEPRQGGRAEHGAAGLSTPLGQAEKQGSWADGSGGRRRGARCCAGSGARRASAGAPRGWLPGESSATPSPPPHHAQPPAAATQPQSSAS